MFRFARTKEIVFTRRGLAFLLLLLLPVVKDGPINFDLLEVKLLLVVVLFIVALPQVGQAMQSRIYQQIVLLVGFSIALTITAYLFSDVKDVSINMTLVAIMNALFMLALCRLFNDELLRLGIVATAIVSLAVCFVAIGQYAVIRFHLSYPLLVALLSPEQQVGYFAQNVPVGEEGIRVSSIFFHSNQLGHYSALIFGFVFPLFLYAFNGRYRALYMLIIVFIIISMFLSQSRGGLILVGVATATTMFMCKGDALAAWKNWIIALIVITAVAVSIFAINTSAFLSRLVSPNLSSRETNWMYALRLIPDNALFGVGRGASGFELTRSFPAVEYTSLANNFAANQAVNYWANNPHNYYLATILESGLFSLVTELVLFSLLIITGIRLVSETEQEIVKAFAVGATSILILECVRGVFEAYAFWNAPETGAIIGFVSALILYLDSRMQSQIIRYDHGMETIGKRMLGENINNKAGGSITAK